MSRVGKMTKITYKALVGFGFIVSLNVLINGSYIHNARGEDSPPVEASVLSHRAASFRFTGPSLGEISPSPESRASNITLYRAYFPFSSVNEDTSSPRFTVVKLDSPARLIVDLMDADISGVESPIEPLNGPFKQLSALQMKGKTAPLGRLIFTLDQHYEHRVVADEAGLSLTLDLPRASADSSEEAEPLTARDTTGGQIVQPPSDERRPVIRGITPTASLSAPQWRVTQVDLRITSSENSLSGEEETHFRVHLSPQSASSPLPTPLVNDSSPRRPHMILRGVRLPERLEQRLDGQELGGPLRFLNVMRGEEESEATAELHLIAEMRHDAAYDVHYLDDEGGDVVMEWIFMTVSDAREGLAQGMSVSADGAPVFRGDESRTPRAPAGTRRKKRYLGKRIKINIKDADIHNVLRFLADCGQVNIVTSDDVEGKVSLMLNQVPWDQALDIILRSKGLDMVREGNIIRVAPREAIAAERKAELEKTQIKEQLKPIMIRLLTVNHAEGKEMVTQVQGVLSERGTVSFDARTNTLIIKDIEEHIEAAEDLVKRLDTQTPQVLIEARIVEVNKVNEKELGIQWGGGFQGVVGSGNATGRAFPSAVGLLGAADDPQFQTPGFGSTPNFMINLPATVGAGAGGAIGLSLGSVDGAFNLNVRLSAAASRGTVKIVSSPKITTLDNHKALISQGVSIPISQVSAQGVQTVFFDATLSLEVTPHVTQDGNIYLQLKANNDTPDFQNVGSRGDPTILKKEASTQVLLQDGETTVIGGIYTSNAGYGLTEWPILSQVPILGALFRKTDQRSQRNELLIFITPRVINRLASRVDTR